MSMKRCARAHLHGGNANDFVIKLQSNGLVRYANFVPVFFVLKFKNDTTCRNAHYSSGRYLTDIGHRHRYGE